MLKRVQHDVFDYIIAPIELTLTNFKFQIPNLNSPFTKVITTSPLQVIPS